MSRRERYGPTTSTPTVRRGEGPPIVFVHGMAMSHTECTPQMEALDTEFTTGRRRPLDHPVPDGVGTDDPPRGVRLANSVAAFPDSDFDASAIEVPTLVVYGENTPAVLREGQPRLADDLVNADAEVTVVPDAGHASNVDNPSFFTATVREFARGIDRE